MPTVNDHNVPPTASVNASVTSGKMRTGDRTMSESQDHSFSRSLSSSGGGGLSRSYSSPNIVKDLRRIEEEEDEEGKVPRETTYSSSLTTSKSYMPHFDRRNKPNLIIPNNFTTTQPYYPRLRRRRRQGINFDGHESPTDNDGRH